MDSTSQNNGISGTPGTSLNTAKVNTYDSRYHFQNEKNKIMKKEIQDVVRISCVKEGENDKFIFTVGQYSVSPLVFDSQEEAEQYLRDNVKQTNLS